MADEVTTLPLTTAVPDATLVLEGRVDIAAIRDGRPYAAGWLRPAAGFRGPFRLILLVGATEIDFGGIAATGKAPDRITFELHRAKPWNAILHRAAQQSFVIRNPAGVSARLKAAPRMLPLAMFYKSRTQFFHHVQDPGRRHPDPETVAYHARRFFDRHRHEAVLCAAALTILGYRILDDTSGGAADAEEIIREAGPILAALETCDTEPKYRWFISLIMVCHYLQILNGRPEACLDQLRQVVARWKLVVQSPAQAGNTLKAVFHLGSALWRLGQREEAETVFLIARDVARRAGATWRFTSWHSANEFVNMGQLTKACMLRLEMLHHAAEGGWRDASYINAAEDPEAFLCLGFPSADMLMRGAI